MFQARKVSGHVFVYVRDFTSVSVMFLAYKVIHYHLALNDVCESRTSSRRQFRISTTKATPNHFENDSSVSWSVEA
jgi:hypothetical protein